MMPVPGALSRVPSRNRRRCWKINLRRSRKLVPTAGATVQFGSVDARVDAGQRRSGNTDGANAGRNSQASVRSSHGEAIGSKMVLGASVGKRTGLLCSPVNRVDREWPRADGRRGSRAARHETRLFRLRNQIDECVRGLTVAQFIFNIIPSIGFSRTILGGLGQGRPWDHRAMSNSVIATTLVWSIRPNMKRD